jgi:hypothetical protein
VDQALNGVAERTSWSSPAASYAQRARRMTMAWLRASALDPTRAEIEAKAAPAPLLRSQDLVAVTMTGAGVLLSSVLGALLFLR